MVISKTIFGEDIKYYTQYFKKKTLVVEFSLHSSETLIKYIVGLHSYLCHTILMFNPTNIDEVSIQATELEARKVKNGMENVYKKTPKFENKSKGKEKRKNI